MKKIVKRKIEDIIRIDNFPGAAAKGLFPTFCNKDKDK